MNNYFESIFVELPLQLILKHNASEFYEVLY